jgi:hypothetical protein
LDLQMLRFTWALGENGETNQNFQLKINITVKYMTK